MQYRLLFMALLVAVGMTACDSGNPPVGEGGQTGNNQVAQITTSTPIPTAPVAARPTYLVQRGNVEDIFEFTGRWEARDQMELSFEISGTIRQVNVRRGDAISQGQLLADYQITDLEDQLASAQLSLESAQSNQTSSTTGGVESVEDAEIALANARLELERTNANIPWTNVSSAQANLDKAQASLEEAERAYQDALSRTDQGINSVDQAYSQLLSAQNSVITSQNSLSSANQSYSAYMVQIMQSENDVLKAELALERARNSQGETSDEDVRSAQLNIDQINADIARSSLYAPIDGVVLDVVISPGDQVTAFDVVITIGIPEPKEVVASLAITDAQRMSVGMIGVCQAANQPETAVQCLIRSIPQTAQDADQTTRIAASLEGMPDGQLVQVLMPLQVEENVLWLPPSVIRTFQNRTFVVLQTADGERAVDVELGLQTDDRVEIVSGVIEGDVVIAP